VANAALSIDRARHVGEAVAAVIAVTPEIADDAAAEVVVDWEPLPEESRELSANTVFPSIMPASTPPLWERARPLWGAPFRESRKC